LDQEEVGIMFCMVGYDIVVAFPFTKFRG